MSDSQDRQAIALFRYGLIAEFVHLPAGTKGLYAQLREKARIDYTIPGTTRTRVTLETLRHWLSNYRRGGFDALLPKGRADRGHSRALPPAVADALISLKDEQRRLSIPQVIRAVRVAGTVPESIVLPPSTVHRLLARAGLMQKTTEDSSTQDRRRFAFAHAGELWMSDVMHGPSVAVLGRGRRKAYLIAFIDDATRLVPYCAFTLSENTQTFLPVFKQAILRRGLPARLFVDNGANYRSQHLALVCAKLGVALIHARPYQAQSKGKIERWFRTVRAQLLSRLTAEDTASLDALNKRLWTWVEAEYHLTPHRGLNDQTPLDRWAMCADQVRLPGAQLDLDALFLFETKRRVQHDRTVSLNGTIFEVDALLVGNTVTLRYDPSVPASRGIEVWHNGQFVSRATPVDVYANCFVRRNRPTFNLDPDAPPAAPRSAGLALRELQPNKPKDKEPR